MKQETRLNEINRLKVKYGNKLKIFWHTMENFRKRIKKLEDYENYVAGLKKQCEEERKTSAVPRNCLLPERTELKFWKKAICKDCRGEFCGC